MTAPPDYLLAVDVQAGGRDVAESIAAGVRDLYERITKRRKLRVVMTKFVNPGVSGPYHRILGYERMSQPEETMFAAALSDMPGEVITKHTYSPFTTAAMCRFAERQRGRSVYVCGLNTEACVLATATGLFDRNVRPIMLTDLLGSASGPRCNEAGLTVMRRMFGSDNLIFAAAAR